MRRFLVFVAAIAVSILCLQDFISSGKLLVQVDLHPDRRGTATGLFYLARCYEIFNKHDRALAYYSRVAERYPKSRFGMNAQFGTALAYERLKHYPQAMDEYNKFLERYPDSPYATSVRNNVEILKSR